MSTEKMDFAQYLANIANIDEGDIQNMADAANIAVNNVKNPSEYLGAARLMSDLGQEIQQGTPEAYTPQNVINGDSEPLLNLPSLENIKGNYLDLETGVYNQAVLASYGKDIKTLYDEYWGTFKEFQERVQKYGKDAVSPYEWERLRELDLGSERGEKLLDILNNYDLNKRGAEYDESAKAVERIADAVDDSRSPFKVKDFEEGNFLTRTGRRLTDAGLTFVSGLLDEIWNTSKVLPNLGAKALGLSDSEEMTLRAQADDISELLEKIPEDVLRSVSGDVFREYVEMSKPGSRYQSTGLVSKELSDALKDPQKVEALQLLEKRASLINQADQVLKESNTVFSSLGWGSTTPEQVQAEHAKQMVSYAWKHDQYGDLISNIGSVIQKNALSANLPKLGAELMPVIAVLLAGNKASVLQGLSKTKLSAKVQEALATGISWSTSASVVATQAEEVYRDIFSARANEGLKDASWDQKVAIGMAAGAVGWINLMGNTVAAKFLQRGFLEGKGLLANMFEKSARKLGPVGLTTKFAEANRLIAAGDTIGATKALFPGLPDSTVKLLAKDVGNLLVETSTQGFAASGLSAYVNALAEEFAKMGAPIPGDVIQSGIDKLASAHNKVWENFGERVLNPTAEGIAAGVFFGTYGAPGNHIGAARMRKALQEHPELWRLVADPALRDFDERHSYASSDDYLYNSKVVDGQVQERDTFDRATRDRLEADRKRLEKFNALTDAEFKEIPEAKLYSYKDFKKFVKTLVPGLSSEDSDAFISKVFDDKSKKEIDELFHKVHAGDAEATKEFNEYAKNFKKEFTSEQGFFGKLAGFYKHGKTDEERDASAQRVAELRAANDAEYFNEENPEQSVKNFERDINLLQGVDAIQGNKDGLKKATKISDVMEIYKRIAEIEDQMEALDNKKDFTEDDAKKLASLQTTHDELTGAVQEAMRFGGENLKRFGVMTEHTKEEWQAKHILTGANGEQGIIGIRRLSKGFRNTLSKANTEFKSTLKDKSTKVLSLNKRVNRLINEALNGTIAKSSALGSIKLKEGLSRISEKNPKLAADILEVLEKGNKEIIADLEDKLEKAKANPESTDTLELEKQLKEAREASKNISLVALELNAESQGKDVAKDIKETNKKAKKSSEEKLEEAFAEKRADTEARGNIGDSAEQVAEEKMKTGTETKYSAESYIIQFSQFAQDALEELDMYLGNTEGTLELLEAHKKKLEAGKKSAIELLCNYFNRFNRYQYYKVFHKAMYKQKTFSAGDFLYNDKLRPEQLKIWAGILANYHITTQGITNPDGSVIANIDDLPPELVKTLANMYDCLYAMELTHRISHMANFGKRDGKGNYSCFLNGAIFRTNRAWGPRDAAGNIISEVKFFPLSIEQSTRFFNNKDTENKAAWYVPHQSIESAFKEAFKDRPDLLDLWDSQGLAMFATAIKEGYPEGYAKETVPDIINFARNPENTVNDESVNMESSIGDPSQFKELDAEETSSIVTDESVYKEKPKKTAFYKNGVRKGKDNAGVIADIHQDDQNHRVRAEGTYNPNTLPYYANNKGKGNTEYTTLSESVAEVATEMEAEIFTYEQQTNKLSEEAQAEINSLGQVDSTVKDDFDFFIAESHEAKQDAHKSPKLESWFHSNEKEKNTHAELGKNAVITSRELTPDILDSDEFKDKTVVIPVTTLSQDGNVYSVIKGIHIKDIQRGLNLLKQLKRIIPEERADALAKAFRNVKNNPNNTTNELKFNIQLTKAQKTQLEDFFKKRADALNEYLYGKPDNPVKFSLNAGSEEGHYVLSIQPGSSSIDRIAKRLEGLFQFSRKQQNLSFYSPLFRLRYLMQYVRNARLLLAKGYYPTFLNKTSTSSGGAGTAVAWVKSSENSPSTAEYSRIVNDLYESLFNGNRMGLLELQRVDFHNKKVIKVNGKNITVALEPTNLQKNDSRIPKLIKVANYIFKALKERVDKNPDSSSNFTEDLLSVGATISQWASKEPGLGLNVSIGDLLKVVRSIKNLKKNAEEPETYVDKSFNPLEVTLDNLRELQSFFESDRINDRKKVLRDALKEEHKSVLDKLLNKEFLDKLINIRKHLDSINYNHGVFSENPVRQIWYEIQRNAQSLTINGDTKTQNEIGRFSYIMPLLGYNRNKDSFGNDAIHDFFREIEDNSVGQAEQQSNEQTKQHQEYIDSLSAEAENQQNQSETSNPGQLAEDIEGFLSASLEDAEETPSEVDEYLDQYGNSSSIDADNPAEIVAANRSEQTASESISEELEEQSSENESTETTEVSTETEAEEENKSSEKAEEVAEKDKETQSKKAEEIQKKSQDLDAKLEAAPENIEKTSLEEIAETQQNTDLKTDGFSEINAANSLEAAAGTYQSAEEQGVSESLKEVSNIVFTSSVSDDAREKQITEAIQKIKDTISTIRSKYVNNPNHLLYKAADRWENLLENISRADTTLTAYDKSKVIEAIQAQITSQLTCDKLMARITNPLDLWVTQGQYTKKEAIDELKKVLSSKLFKIDIPTTNTEEFLLKQKAQKFIEHYVNELIPLNLNDISHTYLNNILNGIKYSMATAFLDEMYSKVFASMSLDSPEEMGEISANSSLLRSLFPDAEEGDLLAIAESINHAINRLVGTLGKENANYTILSDSASTAFESGDNSNIYANIYNAELDKAHVKLLLRDLRAEKAYGQNLIPNLYLINAIRNSENNTLKNALEAVLNTRVATAFGKDEKGVYIKEEALNNIKARVEELYTELQKELKNPKFMASYKVNLRRPDPGYSATVDEVLENHINAVLTDDASKRTTARNFINLINAFSFQYTEGNVSQDWVDTLANAEQKQNSKVNSSSQGTNYYTNNMKAALFFMHKEGLIDSDGKLKKEAFDWNTYSIGDAIEGLQQLAKIRGFKGADVETLNQGLSQVLNVTSRDDIRRKLLNIFNSVGTASNLAASSGTAAFNRVFGNSFKRYVESLKKGDDLAHLESEDIAEQLRVSLGVNLLNSTTAAVDYNDIAKESTRLRESDKIFKKNATLSDDQKIAFKNILNDVMSDKAVINTQVVPEIVENIKTISVNIENEEVLELFKEYKQNIRELNYNPTEVARKTKEGYTQNPFTLEFRTTINGEPISDTLMRFVKGYSYTPFVITNEDWDELNKFASKKLPGTSESVRDILNKLASKEISYEAFKASIGNENYNKFITYTAIHFGLEDPLSDTDGVSKNAIETKNKGNIEQINYLLNAKTGWDIAKAEIENELSGKTNNYSEAKKAEVRHLKKLFADSWNTHILWWAPMQIGSNMRATLMSTDINPQANKEFSRLWTTKAGNFEFRDKPLNQVMEVDKYGSTMTQNAAFTYGFLQNLGKKPEKGVHPKDWTLETCKRLPKLLAKIQDLEEKHGISDKNKDYIEKFAEIAPELKDFIYKEMGDELEHIAGLYSIYKTVRQFLKPGVNFLSYLEKAKIDWNDSEQLSKVVDAYNKYIKDGIANKPFTIYFHSEIDGLTNGPAITSADNIGCQEWLNTCVISSTKTLSGLLDDNLISEAISRNSKYSQDVLGISYTNDLLISTGTLLRAREQNDKLEALGISRTFDSKNIAEAITDTNMLDLYEQISSAVSGIHKYTLTGAPVPYFDPSAGDFFIYRDRAGNNFRVPLDQLIRQMTEQKTLGEYLKKNKLITKFGKMLGNKKVAKSKGFTDEDITFLSSLARAPKENDKNDDRTSYEGEKYTSIAQILSKGFKLNNLEFTKDEQILWDKHKDDLPVSLGFTEDSEGKVTYKDPEGISVRISKDEEKYYDPATLKAYIAKIKQRKALQKRYMGLLLSGLITRNFAKKPTTAFAYGAELQADINKAGAQFLTENVLPNIIKNNKDAESLFSALQNMILNDFLAEGSTLKDPLFTDPRYTVKVPKLSNKDVNKNLNVTYLDKKNSKELNIIDAYDELLKEAYGENSGKTAIDILESIHLDSRKKGYHAYNYSGRSTLPSSKKAYDKSLVAKYRSESQDDDFVNLQEGVGLSDDLKGSGPSYEYRLGTPVLEQNPYFNFNDSVRENVPAGMVGSNAVNLITFIASVVYNSTEVVEDEEGGSKKPKVQLMQLQADEDEDYRLPSGMRTPRFSASYSDDANPSINKEFTRLQTANRISRARVKAPFKGSRKWELSTENTPGNWILNPDKSSINAAYAVQTLLLHKHDLNLAKKLLKGLDQLNSLKPERKKNLEKYNFEAFVLMKIAESVKESSGKLIDYRDILNEWKEAHKEEPIQLSSGSYRLGSKIYSLAEANWQAIKSNRNPEINIPSYLVLDKFTMNILQETANDFMGKTIGPMMYKAQESVLGTQRETNAMNIAGIEFLGLLNDDFKGNLGLDLQNITKDKELNLGENEQWAVRSIIKEYSQNFYINNAIDLPTGNGLKPFNSHFEQNNSNPLITSSQDRLTTSDWSTSSYLRNKNYKTNAITISPSGTQAIDATIAAAALLHSGSKYLNIYDAIEGYSTLDMFRTTVFQNAAFDDYIFNEAAQSMIRAKSGSIHRRMSRYYNKALTGILALREATSEKNKKDIRDRLKALLKNVDDKKLETLTDRIAKSLSTNINKSLRTVGYLGVIYGAGNANSFINEADHALLFNERNNDLSQAQTESRGIDDQIADDFSIDNRDDFIQKHTLTNGRLLNIMDRANQVGNATSIINKLIAAMLLDPTKYYWNAMENRYEYLDGMGVRKREVEKDDGKKEIEGSLSPNNQLMARFSALGYDSETENFGTNSAECRILGGFHEEKSELRMDRYIQRAIQNQDSSILHPHGLFQTDMSSANVTGFSLHQFLDMSSSNHRFLLEHIESITTESEDVEKTNQRKITLKIKLKNADGDYAGVTEKSLRRASTILRFHKQASATKRDFSKELAASVFVQTMAGLVAFKSNIDYGKLREKLGDNFNKFFKINRSGQAYGLNIAAFTDAFNAKNSEASKEIMDFCTAFLDKLPKSFILGSGRLEDSPAAAVLKLMENVASEGLDAMKSLSSDKKAAKVQALLKLSDLITSLQDPSLQDSLYVNKEPSDSDLDWQDHVLKNSVEIIGGMVAKLSNVSEESNSEKVDLDFEQKFLIKVDASDEDINKRIKSILAGTVCDYTVVSYTKALGLYKSAFRGIQGFYGVNLAKNKDHWSGYDMTGTFLADIQPSDIYFKTTPNIINISGSGQDSLADSALDAFKAYTSALQEKAKAHSDYIKAINENCDKHITQYSSNYVQESAGYGNLYGKKNASTREQIDFKLFTTGEKSGKVSLFDTRVKGLTELGQKLADLKDINNLDIKYIIQSLEAFKGYFAQLNQDTDIENFKDTKKYIQEEFFKDFTGNFNEVASSVSTLINSNIQNYVGKLNSLLEQVSNLSKNSLDEKADREKILQLMQNTVKMLNEDTFKKLRALCSISDIAFIPNDKAKEKYTLSKEFKESIEKLVQPLKQVFDEFTDYSSIDTFTYRLDNVFKKAFKDKINPQNTGYSLQNMEASLEKDLSDLLKKVENRVPLTKEEKSKFLDLTSKNALDIFNDLNDSVIQGIDIPGISSVTKEMENYYKERVKSLSKMIGSVALLRAKAEASSQNIGRTLEIDGKLYMVIQEGIDKGRNTPLKMSKKETFAHELSHDAVFLIPSNSKERSQLQNIYKYFMGKFSKLSPEEQIENISKPWYVSENSSLTKAQADQINQHIRDRAAELVDYITSSRFAFEEFIAAAITNPMLMKFLDSKVGSFYEYNAEGLKEKSEEKPGFFKSLFRNILDIFTGFLSKFIGKTLDDKFDMSVPLYTTINAVIDSALEQRNKWKLLNKVQKTSMKALGFLVEAPLLFIDKTASAVTNMMGMDYATKVTTKKSKEWLLKAGKKAPWLTGRVASDLAGEMFSNTPENKHINLGILNKMKNIDKVRQRAIEQGSIVLRDSFLSVAPSEWNYNKYKAISDIFIRTDLGYFMAKSPDYDVNWLKDICDLSTGKLDNLMQEKLSFLKTVEITTAKGKTIKPYIFYKNMADNLAGYLHNGKWKYRLTLQNADKIAYMFGTNQGKVNIENSLTQEEIDNIVKVIDDYVSLKALDNYLKSTDADDVAQVEELRNIIEMESSLNVGAVSAKNSNSEGFRLVAQYMQITRDNSRESFSKLDKDEKFNMRKGYIKESYDSGYECVLVKTKADFKKYSRLGYRPYKGSGLDYTKNPHARGNSLNILMINTYPTSNKRVTGAFAYISSSSSEGMRIDSYYNPTTYERPYFDEDKDKLEINKYMNTLDADADADFTGDLETSFYASGNVSDFSIIQSKDLKDNFLYRDQNGFKALCATNATIQEKIDAEKYNKKFVESLVDAQIQFFEKAYANASKSKKDLMDEEWIQIYPTNAESDEYYQKLKKQGFDVKADAAMLPPRTQAYLAVLLKSNGLKSLRIKKSQYNAIFGYKAFSVKNLALTREQLNKIENKLYRVFAEIGNVLFGNKYAMGAEFFTMKGIEYLKDTIVIRNFTTMIGNTLSNVHALWMRGIPFTEAIRQTIQGLILYKQYMKAEMAKAQAEQKLLLADPNTKEFGEIQAELNIQNDLIRNNPLHNFMVAIGSTAMVEDLDNLALEGKSKNTTRGKINNFLDEVLYNNKYMGTTAKNIVDLITISPSSPWYKFSAFMTAGSDIVSKYVYYKHLRETTYAPEKDPNKFNADEDFNKDLDAMLDAQEAFVFYDPPTNKYLQWMNDMGFAMFTKYFLRMQMAILKVLPTKLGRNLVWMLFKESILGGHVGDFQDTSIFYNPFSIMGRLHGNPWGTIIGEPGQLPMSKMISSL